MPGGITLRCALRISGRVQPSSGSRCWAIPTSLVRSLMWEPWSAMRAREVAEVRHHQNHHALPDVTFVAQPVTEVGEEVSAGGRAVKIGLAHHVREIANAHLPMGKGFAQREAGRELTGVHRKHDHAGTRSFLEQAAQTEIPIEIMSLLDDQPLDFIVGGKIAA